MSVTAALVHRLLQLPSLTDLVGTKIGRDQAPSSWGGQEPYIVAQGEGGTFQFHASGVARPTESRLEIEIYSTNAATADAIQQVIMNPANGINLGTWTAKGIFVQRFMVDGDSHNTAAEVGGKHHRDSQRVLSCTAWWEEAV